MSILAEDQVLVQSAPLAADDHGKTKDPLPQRPRGPHPYRVGREEATDYSEATAVARLASRIGVAA